MHRRLQRVAGGRAPTWSWNDAAIADFVRKHLGTTRDRGTPREVAEYFTDLRKQRCDVGPRCDALLVELEAKCGMLSSAYSQYASMKDRTLLHSVFADTFACKENLPSLLNVLAAEKKETGSVSVESYCALLRYYSRAGRHTEATEAYEHMKAQHGDATRTAAAYWALSCRSWADAVKCEPELIRMGINRNQAQQLTARCCLQGRDIEHATAILKDLTEREVAVGASLRTLLLQHHASAGDLDAVLTCIRSSSFPEDMVAKQLLSCLRVRARTDPNPIPEENLYVLFAKAVFSKAARGTRCYKHSLRIMLGVYCDVGVPAEAARLVDSLDPATRSLVEERSYLAIARAFAKRGDARAAHYTQLVEQAQNTDAPGVFARQ